MLLNVLMERQDMEHVQIIIPINWIVAQAQDSVWDHSGFIEDIHQRSYIDFYCCGDARFGLGIIKW